ncbi:MAG: hypothetical protein ACRBN8_30040 [Nannocystales bacterium]
MSLVVFSIPAIFDYVDHLRAGGDSTVGEASRVGLLCESVTVGGVSCFVHAGDADDATLVCVDENALSRFATRPSKLERLLQRIHRVARELGAPPLSLPLSWRKYQVANHVTFFALPRALNDESLRWAASKLDGNIIAFWALTGTIREIDLNTYVPNLARVSNVRETWREAVRGASFGDLDVSQELHDKVDLEVVGASAIARDLPFTQWLKHLDRRQKQIMEFAGSHSLKVRGIAGSGKTLILQLKALKEMYDAADQGREDRVLYLTHSWALADLVDHSLRIIDDRGIASQISVLPLSGLREHLYGSLPSGVEVLGDDGLEGKRQQLILVSAIVDSFSVTDWPTYRDRHAVSEFVASSVEERDSEGRRALCWMLIREFAEVMDAFQIKPSRTALDTYLAINRSDWMVTLETDGDKRVFYAIFQRFVARLVEEGQMTADQAFDDFRRYLESYAWNIRRLNEGFDLIVVDEFHLFSDSERYLLHLLARDASVPPRMVLALDPRQSPFVLLTGLSDSPVSRQANRDDGDVESVDLQGAHRFSPGILRLVQSIQKWHPAILDEGDDWTFSLTELVSTKSEAGSPPGLYMRQSKIEATIIAVREAKRLQGETAGDQRVALIGAGVQELEAIVDELEKTGENGFTVLDSRDDISQLNYRKRAIVVGVGADFAGLQFSHVAVLVFGGLEASHGRGTSAKRAAVTDLYLSVSRAEVALRLVATEGEGAVPALLEEAVAEGVLVGAV